MESFECVKCGKSFKAGIMAQKKYCRACWIKLVEPILTIFKAQERLQKSGFPIKVDIHRKV